MKRTLGALGLVGAMLVATPASAHLKSYVDGTDDSYQAGDTSTTAHETPIDLSGASFREKAGAYKFKVTFHEPLDPNILWSPSQEGDTIESQGVVSADFFRFVDDARKNWYFVEVSRDGNGNPQGGLFKVTDNGTDFVTDAPVTLSDDGLTLKMSAPRGKLKGHAKGRKIFWNTTSTYWQPAGTGYCEFDSTQGFANGCVDWIPDAADAPHKLQN
jgi:hypothetical protein